jgi:hypothetical protein
MLIYLFVSLLAILWLILGAIIMDRSEVYWPYTRKARLIRFLLHGPAWWAGYLVALLVGIPVYYFQKLSKWIGRKMREANNQGEAKYSPRPKCHKEK